ncbi:hypothetical protein ACJIZ3_024730 [Penstemon smallii]|uniref:Uncharacterized protein n=1 Tax=Penstemon smallii TaxID=265156 RepID=A0ABD3TSS1_9LAMI
MQHESNSFPSTSHPMINDVEDQLCTLKSSEATSTSATSICSNLSTLRDLHESINNMIQLPSIQQSLSNEQGERWINELLEGSLGLVDLCGFSSDILCLTKESVQDLESSIRRNKGEVEEINAYVASRKRIIKKVKNCIKNLKSINQIPTSPLDKDCDLKTIATMLKETEALDFAVLKSVLTLLSAEKGRSKQRTWSLLSKFTNTSRVHSEVEQESGADEFSLDVDKSRTMQNTLKQFKSSETTIQELEEGLGTFFRNQLCRLKSSEATSTSATSICANLASLRDLHEGINNMIQMPSIQQALSNEQGESWMNELLEGSIGLVDLCGFSRDILCLTKESVQELESSIRRNRGETATVEDMNAYVASRKKIVKKLKASEIVIQELEEELETFFKSLVKTRVALLNLLEGSLGLVDLCGFSRDIVCLTKESVQDLESSIRRNRGEDMNVYVASRKMIIKKVNKCIKNLKSFNRNSTSVLLHKDADLNAIATMLKETEALDLSILKSLLTLVSGEKKQSKQRNWSLLSKLTNTSCVHSEVEQESGVEKFSLNVDKSRTMQNTLKQLKASDTTVQEIELGLETFFRSLVKTRVTLLNVLSN